MLLPALALLALFHFYPIWGVLIAFKDYSPLKGLAGSPWVGLDNFRRFFDSPNALLIIRNTLFIAVGKIVFGQLVAVLFSLMLNEVRIYLFKRAVQTATTLPHFLSWVIIGGIMVQILSTSGPVNRLLGMVGIPPIRFLGNPSIFPWTLIFSEVWKEFGFGAVIYLAALTAINPELYEAAAVDGAGRFARLIHITLPGIRPTIILMACLSLGGILNAGFEQVLVLYNPVVYKTGDIIDTFVFRVGLVGQGGLPDYSLGTAVGLFKSGIGFFLIMLSYWLADRFANYRIF
ncbi:MAG: ABC transporter permease subunit [Anaerolineae bacterium]|nr:ABC transporter permease subunit [Anaerolineae bacterium]MDW8099786.1 ABC transporter permease subunit [Anaerolineae bacterium]